MKNELGSNVKYGTRGLKNSRYIYECHRSGPVAPTKGKGIRGARKDGSIKIGGTCPSQIVSALLMFSLYNYIPPH